MGTTRARRGTSAVVLLATLLAATGCGSASPSSTGAAGDALHAPHAAPLSPPQAAAAAQAGTTSAVELRSTLERLLGAHVLYADELARARLSGRQELIAAASASVERNQQQLVDAITALDGPQVGQEFSAAWQNHVTVLGDYGTALREKDTAGQQAARAAYVDAERRLAQSFRTLTGATVPAPALAQAATAHGDHLLAQADAFAAGDYTRAYAVQREAFAHLIMAADVLARGIATAQGLPTGELDAPRRQLQTALSRLLAEHMGLMVQLMRAAAEESPDFAAAGAAVNANTSELGGAIQTLYGEQASRQFLDIWAGHVEALVEYARSADEDLDEVEREQLRQSGADYAPQLARFLAGATGQRLPAIELAAELTEHDEHLRDQVDAYAAGDLEQSQVLAERGYTHMFELAQTLAVAIGDAVAARLPQGGPATGGGGLAVGH
jgi:hypothetical protein